MCLGRVFYSAIVIFDPDDGAVQLIRQIINFNFFPFGTAIYNSI